MAITDVTLQLKPRLGYPLNRFNKAFADTVKNMNKEGAGVKMINDHRKIRKDPEYRKDAILSPFEVNIIV